MHVFSNFFYLAISIFFTFFLPITLILGTASRPHPIEGIIAGVLTFIIMGSYVLYTIILGNRN